MRRLIAFFYADVKYGGWGYDNFIDGVLIKVFTNSQYYKENWRTVLSTY